MHDCGSDGCDPFNIELDVCEVGSDVGGSIYLGDACDIVQDWNDCV